MTTAPGWWLAAEWTAPPRVCAGITTRCGGTSAPPRNGLNLADHVGDDPAAVRANRALLVQALRLPSEPFWLRQQHGAHMLAAGAAGDRAADGSHTSTPGQVCAVLVADCVPLLLADVDGNEVAAVHAGWRGIASGVVETGVSALRAGAGRVTAWIGPCIGPAQYEVHDDVRSACLAGDPGADAHFHDAGPGHWRADLPALVRRRLRASGVGAIHESRLCTHARADLFFSHRRDGPTGRMAALIWIKPASL